MHVLKLFATTSTPGREASGLLKGYWWRVTYGFQSWVELFCKQALWLPPQQQGDWSWQQLVKQLPWQVAHFPVVRHISRGCHADGQRQPLPALLDGINLAQPFSVSGACCQPWNGTLTQ